KGGTKPEQLMLNIDIAPTFLQAAGVKVPADMQGMTLLPLWKGESTDGRKSFFAEYYEEKQFPRIPTWKSVRTETWKYIRYDDHPEWDELYDLQKDPHEMKNLVKDDAAKEKLAELKAEMDRQWKKP